MPLEFVVNEDNGRPYDESTYRHWVSTARAVAVFGFLARDTVRQAIVRAERLTTELIRTVDELFARFPLDEDEKAQRAQAVDQRACAGGMAGCAPLPSGDGIRFEPSYSSKVCCAPVP